MEGLVLAISVVLPLLIYMLVGMLIRHLGILKEGDLQALNHMIFRVLLPLALFFSVYQVDLIREVRPELFAYIFVSVILCFLVIRFIVTRKITDPAISATIVQGLYRSNFVLFGISIGSTLCDAQGLASIAALAAIIVPTFNILAVILFETSRGGKVSVKPLIVEIFKNPLVDAGILGTIVSLLEIRLPELIMAPLEKLGGISTPLALVALGGMLSAKSIAKHKKYLLAAATGRLVLIPMVTLAVGILIGFRGDALVAVLAVFAAPTAVASTSMAQSMGGDGRLAGEIVAATSVGCILTIFLWVLGLSRMGFL